MLRPGPLVIGRDFIIRCYFVGVRWGCIVCRNLSLLFSGLLGIDFPLLLLLFIQSLGADRRADHRTLRIAERLSRMGSYLPLHQMLNIILRR